MGGRWDAAECRRLGGTAWADNNLDTTHDDIAQRILLFSAFAFSDTGRRPMSESTAMDLRLPIGLLFLVLGVILAVFGELMTALALRASSRRRPRGA